VGGRSAHFTGLKSALKSDRPWRQIAGPKLSDREFALATLPLDQKTADRADRANAKASADAAIIGPKDAPINLLGGYRFPRAPKLGPVTRLAILSTETEAEKPMPVEPITAVANADLFELPRFLERRGRS
jgi:hypothetical protein